MRPPWPVVSSNPRLVVALSALALVVVGTWAVKFVQLTRSVSGHAAYWSQQHTGPADLLYVALGDSAAQGIGASRPDRGYVGLLAQRMTDQTGRSVEVINLSRSGARIHDVLDRQLPLLEGLRRTPDLLTVAIGGNDVRAYDRVRFADEAERLAAALPTGAYVADAPYFMHGRWERDGQQAAEVLRTRVAVHGLRPVPLHEALRAQGWKAMLTQFAADWFHPNDRGHRVWANAFWATMKDDPVLQRRGTNLSPSTTVRAT